MGSPSGWFTTAVSCRHHVVGEQLACDRLASIPRCALERQGRGGTPRTCAADDSRHARLCNVINAQCSGNPHEENVIRNHRLSAPKCELRRPPSLRTSTNRVGLRLRGWVLFTAGTSSQPKSSPPNAAPLVILTTPPNSLLSVRRSKSVEDAGTFPQTQKKHASLSTQASQQVSHSAPSSPSST